MLSNVEQSLASYLADQSIIWYGPYIPQTTNKVHKQSTNFNHIFAKKG